MFPSNLASFVLLAHSLLLFHVNYSPTSNLTSQPQPNQKTSKLTTQEHPTSKLTTRQAPTSKSLCHVKNHGFGLVSTNHFFHDFYSSNFFSQTSKSPYFKPFAHPHSLTLDINTTVSTWNNRLISMS